MADFIPDIAPYRKLILGFHRNEISLTNFINGFRNRFNADRAAAKGRRIAWPVEVEYVAKGVKAFVDGTRQGNDRAAVTERLPRLRFVVGRTYDRLTDRQMTDAEQAAEDGEVLRHLETGIAFFDEIRAAPQTRRHKESGAR